MPWDDDLDIPVCDHVKSETYIDFWGARTFIDESDASLGQTMLVKGKHGHGQLLDHSISCSHYQNFLGDGSKPNAVIRRLLGAEAANRFRGPFLLYGESKVTSPRLAWDLDTADLTIALRALKAIADKAKGPHLEWTLTDERVGNGAVVNLDVRGTETPGGFNRVPDP